MSINNTLKNRIQILQDTTVDYYNLHKGPQDVFNQMQGQAGAPKAPGPGSSHKELADHHLGQAQSLGQGHPDYNMHAMQAQLHSSAHQIGQAKDNLASGNLNSAQRAQAEQSIISGKRGINAGMQNAQASGHFNHASATFTPDHATNALSDTAGGPANPPVSMRGRSPRKLW